MAHVNGGDAAWLLVCTGLVLLMVPGLAFFYGGMVQAKNVLSTFMYSFAALCIVTVQWFLCGYSLAFGQSHGGLVGGWDFVGLRGVTAEPRGTVPHLVFMLYQGMFAGITPALISGAVAERMKFSAYCVFVLAWTTLVYDPLAHWVWAPDGWLLKWGALDFAGGTVVHLSSGIAALVAAVMLGKRLAYPSVRHHPHNLTLTVLGGGLLWFGWFGFNGGSAGAADGIAALALVNTHAAAAAGAVAWGLVELRRFGKCTMLGVVSGLVAGLVGITPAAGFVGPMAALAIGAATGVVCYGGVLLKYRLGYDDALDAWGVHGVGGAFGALATGVLAEAAVNPAGADGLLSGAWGLVAKQGVGVVAAAAYSAVVTWGLLRVLDGAVGLRVTRDDEREGLDTASHGEVGYMLG